MIQVANIFQKLFTVPQKQTLSNLIIAVGLISASSFVAVHTNTIIGSFIAIIAWFFIIKALISVRFYRGNRLGGIKVMALLLITWNLFMIVYGIISYPPQGDSTYYIFRRILTDDQLLLPLFFPLLLFMNCRLISLRFLFYWMAVFCIIYLILSPFALWSMVHYHFDYSLGWTGDSNEEGGYGSFIKSSTLQIASFSPIALMYFSKKYLNPKWWYMFVICALISLFIQIYMARRGGTVMTLLFFLAAFGVNFKNSHNVHNRILHIIFLLIAIGLSYALFIDYSNNIFSLFIQRGFEDNRVDIEKYFCKDLNNNPLDWWIGRGLWGTYYDPSFSWNANKGFRWGIETGYLNMILHGGYIYLFLYCSILIYAGVKGLFFSNNHLVNSFGALILLSIIQLYPSGYQTFDFSYLTIWIGVYICCQHRYRKMNDIEIFKILFHPQKHDRYTRVLNKVLKFNK